MDCVDTGRDFWPAAMRLCRKPGIRQRGQRPRWRARVKWLPTLTCLRSNPLERGSSCSTGELLKAEVSNSVPQLAAVEEVVPTARPRQQRAKLVRPRELADEVEAPVQDAVPHLPVWPAPLAATRPSLFRGGKCPARPVVDRCADDLDRAGVGAPAVALESSRRSGDLLYHPTWVRPPPFAGGLPVMARPGIPAMI